MMQESMVMMKSWKKQPVSLSNRT